MLFTSSPSIMASTKVYPFPDSEPYDPSRMSHTVVITVHEYEDDDCDDDEDDAIKPNSTFLFSDISTYSLERILNIIDETCASLNWTYDAAYFDPKGAPISSNDDSFPIWVVSNYFGLDEISW